MRPERRRYRRVDQPFEARYRVYGDLTMAWRTIRTMNISATGMRFRSADLLDPDTPLEIEIKLPTSRESLVVRGHVIWSQPMASGVVENGTEFDELNPAQGEKIDELVKFLTRGGPASSGPA